MLRILVKIVLLLALIGTLIIGLSFASSNKVSKPNYDQVQIGMNRSEVEAILGKAHKQVNADATTEQFKFSGQALLWQKGDLSITVVFVNDKVAAKSQVGL